MSSRNAGGKKLLCETDGSLLRCLRTAFSRPFVVIQHNLRDHLPVVQCFLHLLFQKIEHPAVIRKAHFHFGWMDVDIYLFGIDLKMEVCHRKFMLHQIGLIAALQSF